LRGRSGGREGRVKQNKPAPYSNTDFQENESVFLFESKIDRKYIKTQIRTRDKIPNADGYIEIVDEDNVPIYKFEVQIRTIKNNQKIYYCPIETVCYTNVTTLPILLILVDIIQKVVYWKHLIKTNARQSKKKKSYIFDLSEYDIIGNKNDYITKWKIIAENYIEKIQTISENAILLDTSEEIYPPKNLSQEAIIYFQKYIDRINYLLDHHYSIVKQVYFSKYWKLGVSVYEFGTDVSFEIRGIPYGKSDLLVSEIEKKEEWMSSKKFLHRIYFLKMEDDSEKRASEFVLQYAKKVFDRKLLLPVGQKLTEEYVYFVISKCYYMFGLEKKDSYNVNDISNGLNKYLLLWVSIALDHIDYPKNPIYPNEVNVIDIVYLADILYFFPTHFPKKNETINQVFNKVISGQEHHEIKGNIKFNSKRFDFYVFINSLNYLKDHNVMKVEASLIEPNYELIKNKKMFLRCNLYTPENRREYVIKFYKAIQAIINEFVDYYKLPKEYRLYSNEKYHYFIIPSFVKRQIGNDFLEEAEVIIIIAERFEDEINNVTIIEDEECGEKLNFIESWEKGFFYNGRTYNLISWSDGFDIDVFDELPFYNRVYSHLQEMFDKIRKKDETHEGLL